MIISITKIYFDTTDSNGSIAITMSMMKPQILKFVNSRKSRTSEYLVNKSLFFGVLFQMKPLIRHYLPWYNKK